MRTCIVGIEEWAILFTGLASVPVAAAVCTALTTCCAVCPIPDLKETGLEALRLYCEGKPTTCSDNSNPPPTLPTPSTTSTTSTSSTSTSTTTSTTTVAPTSTTLPPASTLTLRDATGSCGSTIGAPAISNDTVTLTGLVGELRGLGQ